MVRTVESVGEERLAHFRPSAAAQPNKQTACHICAGTGLTAATSAPGLPPLSAALPYSIREVATAVNGKARIATAVSGKARIATPVSGKARIATAVSGKARIATAVSGKARIATAKARGGAGACARRS